MRPRPPPEEAPRDAEAEGESAALGAWPTGESGGFFVPRKSWNMGLANSRCWLWLVQLPPALVLALLGIVCCWGIICTAISSSSPYYSSAQLPSYSPMEREGGRLEKPRERKDSTIFRKDKKVWGRERERAIKSKRSFCLRLRTLPPSVSLWVSDRVLGCFVLRINVGCWIVCSRVWFEDISLKKRQKKKPPPT